MTPVPFIVGLATLTLLFFVVANLRAAKDVLAAGVLLRFYLYIASFVTLVILVTGLTYTITGLFSLATPDFSYSRGVVFRPAVTAPNAPPVPDEALQRQQAEEHQRDQQSTDLIRGGTLAVMGGLLFGIHTILRRRTSPDQQAEGNFYRGFLVVGLVTFGIVGLVALPVGVYQAIKFLLIAPLSTQPRVAPGNTLATGIVLTPLWVWYLLALSKQARQPRPAAALVE